MATLKDFAFATVMDVYGFVGADKDNKMVLLNPLAKSNGKHTFK